MESFWKAFFPNIARSKRDVGYLCRKYAHTGATTSSDSISMGSHVAHRMGCQAITMIGSTLFFVDSAIRTLVINFATLIAGWMLRKFGVGFTGQGTSIYNAMMLRRCWRGTLPFFLSVGVLMAKLYNCIAIRNPSHGRQFFRSFKPVTDGNASCYEQPFVLSLLQYSTHDHVGLALHCICSTANLKAHVKHKNVGFDTKYIQKDQEVAFWRIMTANEQYWTSLVVLAALQLFLQLTKVNATLLFLPLLFQITGSRSNAALMGTVILVLVNAGGILGSAFTMKHYGREVMLMISVVLIIFCQITIPWIMEIHIGSGGGIRMPMGYTAAVFVLTCVVSSGFSWSWGALFWSIPSEKIRSAGQVVGMAINFGLSFVQMQYFLLILCRLKSAIVAYYAMWIWL